MPIAAQGSPPQVQAPLLSSLRRGSHSRGHKGDDSGMSPLQAQIAWHWVRGSVTGKIALNRSEHWAAGWVCSWWFMELSWGEHSHSWAELLNWASRASVSLATK